MTLQLAAAALIESCGTARKAGLPGAVQLVFTALTQLCAGDHYGSQGASPREDTYGRTGADTHPQLLRCAHSSSNAGYVKAGFASLLTCLRASWGCRQALRPLLKTWSSTCPSGKLAQRMRTGAGTSGTSGYGGGSQMGSQSGQQGKGYGVAGLIPGTQAHRDKQADQGQGGYGSSGTGTGGQTLATLHVCSRLVAQLQHFIKQLLLSTATFCLTPPCASCKPLNTCGLQAQPTTTPPQAAAAVTTTPAPALAQVRCS